MTIEEYIKWKATHKDDVSKTLEECCAADTLIRQEALKAWEAYSARHILVEAERKFVNTCVRTHYGSADVDEMFKALGIWPEWM